MCLFCLIDRLMEMGIGTVFVFMGVAADPTPLVLMKLVSGVILESLSRHCL
ncbi:hypothetical protein T07_9037 [Trichinella nelsoni]|uniref:Uncharacterized protein n=1 Tax=Trichinella nelsoni TaxID=6336 RepID=A0A0V0RBI5_9BILA|nr:hypothetical protein T07_9037 [Trichinella nelsoni]